MCRPTCAFAWGNHDGKPTPKELQYGEPTAGSLLDIHKGQRLWISCLGNPRVGNSLGIPKDDILVN